MSNLRSDCRDLVKNLPAGDVMKSHVEALCYQIDELEERWHKAEKRLQEVRDKLEEIVCTKPPDDGVILLSDEGASHYDENLKCHVYDHQHFSPLGDALMAAWKLTDLHERFSDG